MGSLARTIHTTASLSTSTMKIVLAFCLVAAFACTAESRSHGKINAFLKRMEKTVAKVQDADYDDCDVDGGDGYLYWCPGDGSGSCCTHPASVVRNQMNSEIQTNTKYICFFLKMTAYQY